MVLLIERDTTVLARLRSPQASDTLFGILSGIMKRAFHCELAAWVEYHPADKMIAASPSRPAALMTMPYTFGGDQAKEL